MIRTTSKEKLPKGFSYPVGAGVISSALQGVPQFSLAAIHFSWKDTFWASRYNEKLKALGQITILDVNYSARWYEWRISVHAVPSAHKQAANAQLQRSFSALGSVIN